MSWLIGVLLLFGAAFATRMTYKERPQPRRKPGESEAEGHVMLLGTYRIYTWLLWLVIGLSVPSMLLREGGNLSLVLLILLLLSTAGLLLAARALYWRLGYDQRSFIFVLGHLSGAFALSERFYALELDIQAYLRRQQGI